MPRRLPAGFAAGIMLRGGVVPLDVYPGAMKPWPSICVECGREVTPTLDKVHRGHLGCKHCAGLRDMFPTVEREQELRAAMLQAGFLPIAAYPGSERRWSSVHLLCGREVAPTLRTVCRGGGCRRCTVAAKRERSTRPRTSTASTTASAATTAPSTS